MTFWSITSSYVPFWARCSSTLAVDGSSSSSSSGANNEGSSESRESSATSSVCVPLRAKGKESVATGCSSSSDGVVTFNGSSSKDIALVVLGLFVRCEFAIGGAIQTWKK